MCSGSLIHTQPQSALDVSFQIEVINSSIKYANSHAAVRGHAPTLGEHNADVLGGVHIGVEGAAIGAELHLTEAQRDEIAARLSSAARLIARARADAADAGAPPANGAPKIF